MAGTPTASASGISPRSRSPTSPPPAGTGRCPAGSNGSTGSWAARPTSGIRNWSTTAIPSRRPPPRRGLPPVGGPGRQGDRVHPGRQGGGTRQAVVLLRLPGRRSRAAPRLQGMGGPLRRHVRHGLRTLSRDRAGEPEEAGHRRTRYRTVRGQPVFRRHGRQRRTLAGGGHRAALGLAERRGAQAVLPDGRGVRRFPVLHRCPTRPDPGLPGGIRPAGQHPDRGDLGQRRQRRGRAERLGQRGEVLQRLRRHRRGGDARLRRARGSDDLQPLSDRLGDGVQHALQALQALRLARGRHRRHGDHLLAQGDCRARRGPGQLCQRLRHHPHGLRTVGYLRSRQGEGHRAEAAGGSEFRCRAA